MNELAINQNTQVRAINNFDTELFTRWTNYIDAKPKTVETYTKAINQFLYWLNDNGIKQPTRADVIAFRNI